VNFSRHGRAVAQVVGP